MKVLSVIVFLLLFTSICFAETDTIATQKPIPFFKQRQPSTNIHIGVGIQKLFHYGIKQQIGPFFLGADIGYMLLDLHSLTGTIGYCLNNSTSAGGSYLSFQYTEGSYGDPLLNHNGSYSRFSSLNFGWVGIAESGLTVDIKIGPAILFEVYYERNYIDGTTKGIDPHFYPFFNAEFEFGFSF